MKAFQYLIAICLCCIFSIRSFAQTLYKVTAERVNVRNKPSSQALIVGVVNKGDIISVSEISNGWATILFKDKTRYMDARYIEPAGNVKGADNALAINNTVSPNIRCHNTIISHDIGRNRTSR